MRILILALAVVFTSNIAMAQDAEVDRVLAKYLKLRPSEAELAMYSLDWADSLAEALQRGVHENRPIAVVIIHAQYGDIRSGHC
jgi:hypothetical protein